MARYNLILKDKTYITIVEYAARHNTSVGKVLNQLCDKFAKEQKADGHVPVSAVCIICGKAATLEVHGKGQQKLYVCTNHRTFARKFNGYRELHHSISDAKSSPVEE